MKIRAWVQTDKGLRRESNQDSSLVRDDLGLYIVADGMGGHSGGEVASLMAVTAVEKVIVDSVHSHQSAESILMQAYKLASNSIFDKAAFEKPELTGMGTTMVLAYQKGNNIYIGNVGDSRCYLLSKSFLWQLTEDHSLINEHIRSGVMSEAQVRNLIGKNVITRSVGYEREVEPDIIERKLVPGDIYLLCSDGLSGLVSDPQIAEILNTNNCEKAVGVCIKQALANGGDDNVTVLILEVTE